jgi:large subunit ribosomal protein L21
MYAVIKTGGKQYRVRPGDLLVVEKLPGEPGAKVAFDQVLAVGEGEALTLGAPVVEGASVSATLIETRRGEKVKIFKKIRRQGYRRTRGHRQPESVLRVTAVALNGKSETWDGEVDLTPLAELNLRARNLSRAHAALTPAAVDVETVVEPEGPGKARRTKAKVVEAAEPIVGDLTDESLDDAGAAAALLAEAAAEAVEAHEDAKKAPAKKTATPKEPKTSHPTKAQAKAGGAPKLSKAQVKAAPIRKSAPRGKGG